MYFKLLRPLDLPLYQTAKLGNLLFDMGLVLTYSCITRGTKRQAHKNAILLVP
jgi:hypothetical protein